MYLEETFVDELRGFVATLPLDVLARGAAAAATAEEQAAAVLRTLVEAATQGTTIADPKDLFGKWCASLLQCACRLRAAHHPGCAAGTC